MPSTELHERSSELLLGCPLALARSDNRVSEVCLSCIYTSGRWVGPEAILSSGDVRKTA